jgi:hypothetical protein
MVLLKRKLEGFRVHSWVCAKAILYPISSNKAIL